MEVERGIGNRDGMGIGSEVKGRRGGGDEERGWRSRGG